MNDDTQLSRQNSSGEEMVELRVMRPNKEIAILDGHCIGTGKSRTDVIGELLAIWSADKEREAIMICRVAGINPNSSEYDRKDEE